MRICWKQGIGVVAVLTLLPLLGLAQGADKLRIGFVDVARLLQESPQASSAMKALEDEFAPRQRDIVAQQNSFKERQEKIRRDLDVMGADERRNAEVELRRDERELAREQEEFREDFNLRRNEELGKLQRELLREVQAFAREAKYDLIVSDGVLYVDQSIDVTAQILAAMQSRAGSAAP